MKDYVDALVKELPQYMTHFVASLVSPRKFISQRLSSDSQQEDIKTGVSFLILSFTLAMILVVNFPDASNPTKMLASDAKFAELASEGVYQLFLVLGGAFIAYFCWKVAGVNTPFSTFFSVVSYFCGIALVLNVFIGASSNIALLDPVVGKAWVNMEKVSKEMKPALNEMLCAAGDSSVDQYAGNQRYKSLIEKMKTAEAKISAARQQPLAKIGVGIQLVLTLFVLAWMIAAWWFYGKIHQVSGIRIIVVGLIAIFLLFSGSMAVDLIRTSAEQMAVLRAC